MRHDPDRRLARALLGEVLPGGHAVHFVRCGSGIHLSLGGDFAPTAALRIVGNGSVSRHFPGWVLLRLEKRSVGLGRDRARKGLMPLAAPITDLEQLKNHPAVACLVAWNTEAVQGVKFDREEMTIYVDRAVIREACALLREN